MFLTWKRFTALSYALTPISPSLYLTDATTAVGAADGVHVTSSLLGTTMVSSNALITTLNRKHTAPSPMHTTNTYLRLKGMLADYGRMW